jgi:hypothetical protein
MVAHRAKATGKRKNRFHSMYAQEPAGRPYEDRYGHNSGNYSQGIAQDPSGERIVDHCCEINGVAAVKNLGFILYR